MDFYKLQSAFETSFLFAIKNFGASNFKRTSFFGSNEKACGLADRKAA
jgi:hypothetical protein